MSSDDDTEGGRIFFSAGPPGAAADEIALLSAGIDIGSSTSHLVFSRLLLERQDNRHVVTSREVLHESDVLITPYAADGTIDAAEIGAFFAAQHRIAGLEPGAIDTGALILTGVAVRRANARAIGEALSAQAGKLVSLAAGDAMETTLAAHGSGAVALSARESCRVMNIDIGGGTTKIAVAESGEIVEITALDIGARVIVLDADCRVTRIEEAGRLFAEEAGVAVAVGEPLSEVAAAYIAERMADRLIEAASANHLSPLTQALLRLPPLSNARPPDKLTFSGGVSEYIYRRERTAYGDLGPLLAHAVRQRLGQLQGVEIVQTDQGIRATVVGASQYTVQISGATIHVSPASALPLANVPAIAPALPLDADVLDAGAIATTIALALSRRDLAYSEQPVVLAYRWQGSATYQRLDAFCAGILQGLGSVVARGYPLVLVGEGDVGRLLGLHLAEEANYAGPVVSIDGILLADLDFIDIGAMLPGASAVPVVVKSLVFPASAGGTR